MIDGVRVLDLTDERGNLAGQMLAGLGADVIAIEPPGGQPARRLGPFAGDEPGPDRSLVHWSMNRGKRSVVLDLASSEDDRARFRELVRRADIVLETASPRDRARLCLPAEDLAALNPALVQVSVTSFGTTGPRADWEAPDLVALAASGQLRLCGDADRAPLRCSVPQAWAHASSDAACAALVALWERRRSGLGQHCDVSAQISVMQATQSLILNHPYGVPMGARVGGGMRLGPLDIRLVWPCKDGTVTITFLFGASAGPFSARLFQWIYEEGGCDEATRDLDWIGLGNALSSGEVPISEFDRVKGLLEAFCLTKTKDELLEAAMERKLLIAPASTIADVFANEQFVERDYWDVVEAPEGDSAIRYPGPFVRPSSGRLPALHRPPRLGEHTEEVLAELSAATTPAPATAPAPASTPARPAAAPAREANGSADAADRRPLAGVKVLDFMWSLAGPQITRVLADCGATIVRVESSKKIEMGRTLNPFWQDKTDVEASGLFNNANAGKLGICLDLNTEQGRDVVRDLVRWADVVTESYSPRAMARWGLTYDKLREINPSIVMLSSCLMGQTGPLANFAGFGNLAAAFAGFFYTTGWPDRTPVGPYGGYTDYLSPRFAVASLMAALERRARTGEGCYLDFSQAEAAMWALGPAFADFEVNGRNWERAGNRDRNHAPNMVAPAAGEDRWLAIVCETDEQWRALCRLAGFDEAWAALGRAERLARVDEVEDLVAGWTSTQYDHDLAARLQAAGVPAHVLLDSEEVWKDPQLDHRGHFVEVDHASLGRIPIEGPRFTLSRTPVGPTAAGPTLGQHAWEILTEFCGYDADRIADLAAAEVLE